MGLSDGRVLPVQIEFDVSFANEVRTVHPKIIEKLPIRISSQGKPVSRVAIGIQEKGFRIVTLEGSTLTINKVIQYKTLMGKIKRKESRIQFELPISADVTAMTIPLEGNFLYIG